MFNKSIQSIIAPIAKVQKDLEQYAKSQGDKASAALAERERLNTVAVNAATEASTARNIARNIGDMLGANTNVTV